MGETFTPQQVVEKVNHFREASNRGENIQGEFRSLSRDEQLQVMREVWKDKKEHPGDLPNISISIDQDTHEVKLDQKGAQPLDTRTPQQKQADDQAHARGEFTQQELADKIVSYRDLSRTNQDVTKDFEHLPAQQQKQLAQEIEKEKSKDHSGLPYISTQTGADGKLHITQGSPDDVNKEHVTGVGKMLDDHFKERSEADRRDMLAHPEREAQKIEQLAKKAVQDNDAPGSVEAKLELRKELERLEAMPGAENAKYRDEVLKKVVSDGTINPMVPSAKIINDAQGNPSSIEFSSVGGIYKDTPSLTKSVEQQRQEARQEYDKTQQDVLYGGAAKFDPKLQEAQEKDLARQNGGQAPEPHRWWTVKP